MFDVGTLAGFLELEDRLSPALKIAEGNLATTGTKLTDLGKSLTSTATTILPLSLAISGVGLASTAMAGTFEASMTRLVSTAGVSADEIDNVKQHILDLAPAIGIGPQALADAMTKVSSTVGSTSAALEILDTAALGTKAGFGDTIDVAGALTTVINTYGESNITAARAGDILAEAIKAGGAEASELAPTLNSVVPFASALGISFEEVAANLATLTKLGVPTSEAVTSLTSVFSALSRETSSGKEALDGVGLSYGELRQQIREKGLMDTLITLSDTFKGNEKGLIDVLGRLEALKNVMGTAGAQAGAYAEVLDKVKSSSDTAGGSLKNMADAMTGKTVQTWNEVWAAVEVLGIKLGDVLAPAIGDVLELAKPMIEWLEDAVKWFGELPGPIQTSVIALGGIVAVAPAVLFFFGAAFTIAGTLATALGTLAGAFGVSAVAATGASGVMIAGMTAAGTAAGTSAVPIAGFWAAVLGPVGIGVAIAGLIAGLITMNGWWDEIAGALKVAWQWFTDVGKIVLWLDQQILSSLWDMLKDIAGYVRDTVVLVFKYLYDEFVNLVGYIPGLNTLWERMTDVLGIVWDIAGKVVDVLSDLAGKAAKWLGDTFNELKAMADNGQKAITPLVSTLETDLAGRALPAVFYGMHDANDASVIYGDGLKDVEKHTKDVEKASEDYRKEIDELTKSLKGSGAIDSAKKYMDALIGVNDISKLTKDKQEEINGVLMAGIEAYRSQGKEAPAEMLKVATATSSLKADVDALTISEIAAIEAVGPNAWDASEKAIRDHIAVIVTLEDEWKVWQGIVADPAPWAAADANVKAYIDSLETSVVKGTGISKTFGEKLGAGLKESLGKALEEIPAIIARGLAEGSKGSDMAKAVGSLLGSAIGEGIGTALGGKVGGKIGGALGAIAGAFAGQLVDALNRSAGEDVVRRLGHDWGVAITEEMGDAIAETADNLFGGNRLAAEIFHFDDILTAAGGLTLDNFNTMLGKLRDTFVLLATDVFSTSDAVTVLDTNFGAFADHAIANGGLVTDQFLEIIRLADAAGLHIQAIDDFVTGQVTSAVEGITLVLVPAYDLITAKEEELRQLRIDAADASEEEVGELLDRIGVLEDELVALTGVTIQTQDAATGFATALFASFGELIERGMDTKDALELIKPAVDVLQQEMKDLGFDGGEAFDLLARMSKIAGDDIAGPMVDAIHGGADALTGLHNAGILNQTMFTGLTTQITTTFDALVKRTGDGGAALQLLAPDIQRVWELQTDFGYAVSDSTQLLIDQAIEAGLVGDAHRNAQDVAILAMQNAADAMIRVADAIEKAFLTAGAASGGFADTVNDNVRSIPSNPFSGWQIPELQMPSIPDYTQPSMDVYPMAEGGIGKVSSPTLFLAGEAGPEEWAFSGAGRTFADYGGSRSNVHDDEVHQELVAIRRGQSDLPFVLVRALQTARALD